MKNPYSKECPHCRKKFQARRLNQAYCTYFCKVRFNNEKARLKRLRLHELERRYSQETKESSPKLIPQSVISKPLTPKIKSNPTLSFLSKNEFLIGIGLVLIGGIVYFFTRKPKKEKQEIAPHSAPDKPSIEQVVHKMKTYKNQETVTPIPLEITTKKEFEAAKKAGEFSKNSPSRDKNYFFEFHPDTAGHQRVLDNQKRVT